MQTVSEVRDGFKETEIGLIPEDWELVKLNEIFDIQQGKAMSPKSRSGSPQYPFLRTLNVLWGRIDLSALDHMHFTAEEISRLRLQPYDLLVCEGGEVGRTAMWRGEIEICGYQNHIHCLRKRKADIWPEFYMYWMQAAFLQLGLYGGERIKTTIPNLSIGRLRSFILPKPPFQEQQKIAFILSKIQQAIRQQDKIIEATKNLKKSLMHKLFTEGTRGEEQKETEIGLIPKSWEVIKLGNVGEFCYGYTTSAVEEKESVRFIRITDIKEEGNILWENVPYCKILVDELEKYQLAEGDILFARIGATTGKTCIIESPPIAIFGSYLIRLRIKEKSMFLPKFVYYFTKTDNYWKWINANKEGKLKKGVSASFLKTLPIPIPSPPEQQEIIRILNTLDKKIETEERRKAAFQQLFKTMLNKLMTGEIRVKDLDLGVTNVS
jgi:type I restriction enzyme S subunit